jgi:hypothetical protein
MKKQGTAINLETSVGSQKSTQALDAPGKPEKALITNKVTSSFSDSPCTPITYTSFSRPTKVSRFIRMHITSFLNDRKVVSASSRFLQPIPTKIQSHQHYLLNKLKPALGRI